MAQIYIRERFFLKRMRRIDRLRKAGKLAQRDADVVALKPKISRHMIPFAPVSGSMTIAMQPPSVPPRVEMVHRAFIPMAFSVTSVERMIDRQSERDTPSISWRAVMVLMLPRITARAAAMWDAREEMRRRGETDTKAMEELRLEVHFLRTLHATFEHVLPKAN